jgi:hypothetical protein
VGLHVDDDNNAEIALFEVGSLAAALLNVNGDDDDGRWVIPVSSFEFGGSIAER